MITETTEYCVKLGNVWIETCYTSCGGAYHPEIRKATKWESLDRAEEVAAKVGGTVVTHRATYEQVEHTPAELAAAANRELEI